MTDRDKVIKGLECCKTDVPFSKCYKCPYVTCFDRDGFFVECNREDMMSDAIALLKAQEPRVMTYYELATFDGAFLIESSAISQLDWVFFFDTDTKSDAIWVEGFDGERSVVYREDYGTYLRCWTSRPTAEQREAVKWDG